MENLSTTKLFALYIGLVVLALVGGGTFGMVLVSCATPVVTPQVQTRVTVEEVEFVTIIKDQIPYGLHRVVDEQAGLVCHVIHTYKGMGVSCIPLSQTTLEGEEGE